MKTIETARRRRAWLEIDLSAIAENAKTLQSLLPAECRLMAVLKANAYGHGDVQTAAVLRRAGVSAFATATVSEAVRLRRKGIRGDILVFGFTDPEDVSLLQQYDLMQTMLDPEYAEMLNAFGRRLNVQVKIDSGMHRTGEDCRDYGRIRRMFQYRNLRVCGTWTHFAQADGLDADSICRTRQQQKRFEDVLQMLREDGLDPGRVHLQSSYGILNYPQINADYARAGIVLYGVHSDRRLAEAAAGIRLRPALSLRAAVVQTRQLQPGESAGYNGAFTADRPTWLAVVSCGYADGIPRALSCGRGQALVQGRRVPTAGMICMDQLLLDVTDLPRVPIRGEVVTLIGRDGEAEIPVWEVAETAGTISNEILSRLGERLERLYHPALLPAEIAQGTVRPAGCVSDGRMPNSRNLRRSTNT